MLRTIYLAAVMTAFSAAAVFAEDLPTPAGDVVLTVSGNVVKTNVDQTARLDLEMLEAMGTTTIETTTIWTEGMQVFQGVSLKALVEELGIEGTILRASAINDYTVEVPMSDAVEGGALVAYRLNGDAMSVRDKGPLWIIYPYDSDADYRTEVIYSRSIWQLDRIEAID